MKAVLHYPGSKWKIAPEIVKRIPEHHAYCEPYFGSGAVFFSKEPSDIELINDLDNNVAILFRCIRDDPEKLAGIVAATPYSRFEYERVFSVDDEADDFSRALSFLIACWQGYGFRTNGYREGWKNDVHGRESMYALRNWYNLPGKVLEVAERLRYVQIDNRPALEVIKRFNHSDVFIYIDPPYLLNTRSGRQKQYRHEMTDADHEELIKTILRSKAKIMISGYESEMYNDYLGGWHKEFFQSCARYNNGNRTEVIWMNYGYYSQIPTEDLVQQIKL